MTEPLMPAVTTHTVIMSQVTEINVRLADQRDPSSITADQLGLPGAAVRSSGTTDGTTDGTTGETAGGLPGQALLHRLCYTGTPEWPYIHGHFGAPASTGEGLIVEFHSAALRELSHRLRFRHVWGD